MNHQRIGRRAWMAGTLAGVAELCGGLSRGDEAGDGLDVIDCHTHFYDPARPEGVPWPGKGTSLYRTVLPRHLRELEQYLRVTGTVVVEASPRVEDNAWLLALAKDDPFVVGVVGNLAPGTPEFAGHLTRFAADALFRGIRVSSTRVEELLAKDDLADLARLADRDLALDVNGGPDSPAVVARLGARLPTLRIVQNHIGNVRITADPPPRDWRENIAAAARRPNVYCKVSALVEGAARDGKKAPADPAFYRPYLDVVWDAFGPDRVVYGSNWPVCESAADYETVQRITLEDAAARGSGTLAKFCAENSKRAYQWAERPGRRGS